MKSIMKTEFQTYREILKCGQMIQSFHEDEKTENENIKLHKGSEMIFPAAFLSRAGTEISSKKDDLMKTMTNPR